MDLTRSSHHHWLQLILAVSGPCAKIVVMLPSAVVKCRRTCPASRQRANRSLIGAKLVELCTNQ